MNRLLEGDVGSGKTVVATMAMLETAKAGFQVAFMAPTEILAQQHFKEINKLLIGFNLHIGLITSEENKIEDKITKRSAFLEKIKTGKLDILIGTCLCDWSRSSRRKGEWALAVWWRRRASTCSRSASMGGGSRGGWSI